MVTGAVNLDRLTMVIDDAVRIDSTLDRAVFPKHIAPHQDNEHGVQRARGESEPWHPYAESYCQDGLAGADLPAGRKPVLGQ
jgi:hypothetical protein